MQSIYAVQEGIRFIEARLPQPIAPEAVAAHVHMSPFHFYRLFTLLTGISLGTYMTRRRLSMAGDALSLGMRVLDCALEHGYETPEGFQKAFVRFHGITPSMARQGGVTLRRFDPLSIKITVEGGLSMEYRIEKLPARQYLVCAQAFDSARVNEEGNHEIPDFWDVCIENGTLDVLKGGAAGPSLYGVCSPVSDTDGCFDYGIGVLAKEGAAIPDGLGLWTVPAHTYAVFACVGENADCIGDVWTRIFKEFLPQSPYDMVETYDLEYYPPERKDNLVCEVWLPVRKK